MLSSWQFVRQSLELNLFFLRIMKEHSFFIEAGFTPKNSNLGQRAEEFKNVFTGLLAETVMLSNGVVTESVLSSGEVVTQYTYEAERATEYYTGIAFDSRITTEESTLSPSCGFVDVCQLEPCVTDLNQRILSAVSSLINFKTEVLDDMLSCRIFTTNYPLLIDHVRREAELYVSMLSRIQERIEICIEDEAVEQEAFWSRIMAEHAKFIRGLLDPTEESLISTANRFANQFDRLTAEAIEVNDSIYHLTDRTLRATVDIRDFKSTGTAGILNCEIKSIIVPILGDHTLREANHFLRLLELFEHKL